MPKSVRTIHSPGYWSPGYRDTSAHSLYQTKKHRIKVSEKGSIHSRKQQVSAEVKERLSAEKQALNAAQGVETPNEEGAATAEIDAGEEEHMDDEHDLYHNHEEYNDDGSDEEYAEAHHEV